MIKNELNEHQECIIFAKFLKSINCLYTKTAQEIRTNISWFIKKNSYKENAPTTRALDNKATSITAM